MQYLHGGDIYGQSVTLDFSANLNPLGMPESVREAALRGVYESEKYPDYACRQLISAISQAEHVDASYIICGNGAAELIFGVAAAVKPKKALLIAPGFVEYEAALRAVDAEIITYACGEERDFLMGEDFLSLLTEDLDMVFLCNPNNPTGLPIPPVLLRQIAADCVSKNIILVLDECFNGLWIHGETGSLKELVPQMPQLFILRAYTKLYAMAGLRLGYAMCSDTVLLEDMHRLMQPWNVSIPAQAAGSAAAELTDYPERTRRYVAVQLQLLKKGLREAGIRYWDSEANYIFFKGPEDLQERMREHGILIRSCSNFRGLGSGYFRIAVRTEEENKEFLQVLSEVMGSIHHKEG